MLFRRSHRAASHLYGSRGGNAAVFSLFIENSPAPSTPVHVPKGQSEKEQSTAREDEGDEEQRKSANRVYGPPAPGGRSEGFPATSIFDPTLLPQSGAGEWYLGVTSTDADGNIGFLVNISRFSDSQTRKA